jgi:hypothetical protein
MKRFSLNGRNITAAADFLPRDASLLKFNGQTGIWSVKGGVDLTGEVFIADPFCAGFGWTRWENRMYGARYIVRVPREPMSRSELPEQDPGKWPERDSNGHQKDPYQFAGYLPLVHCETDQKFVYATQSDSGLRERICRG